MCKSRKLEMSLIESDFLRGLVQYTEREANNLRGSQRVAIAGSDEQISDFVERSLSGEYRGKKLLLGKINAVLAQRIYDRTGVDLKGYNLEFRSNEIKHAFNHHGDSNAEMSRGQQAITTENILAFPRIVTDFDEVSVSRDNGLQFIKYIGGRITAVTAYADGNKSLALKTMYKVKNSGNSGPATDAEKTPGLNVRNDWTTVPADNTNTNNPNKC